MTSQHVFCGSLRVRPPWQRVFEILQATEELKMIQSLNCLEMYDIALETKTESSLGPQTATNTLHILLFSQSDTTAIGMPKAEARIHRLIASTGGLGIAIVFLLNESQHSGGSQSTDGLVGLSMLQERIIDMDSGVPILPLATLDDLPATLSRYKAGIENHQRRPGSSSTLELLPYATVHGKLREHSVHVLTDITDSLKTLSECTRTDSGREKLIQWLDGDDERIGILQFWKEEFIVD